jgi:hypothetical protein
VIASVREKCTGDGARVRFGNHHENRSSCSAENRKIRFQVDDADRFHFKFWRSFPLRTKFAWKVIGVLKFAHFVEGRSSKITFSKEIRLTGKQVWINARWIEYPISRDFVYKVSELLRPLGIIPPPFRIVTFWMNTENGGTLWTRTDDYPTDWNCSAHIVSNSKGDPMTHREVISAEIALPGYFRLCAVSKRCHILGNGTLRGFSWNERKMASEFLMIRDELSMDSCHTQTSIRIIAWTESELHLYGRANAEQELYWPKRTDVVNISKPDRVLTHLSDYELNSDCKHCPSLSWLSSNRKWRIN